MDGITLVSISNSNQFPNTGLDQICKCLRDNGHFVNVKYFHNGESVEQMTTELIGLNASIYGFSTSALNIKLIESICKKIKKIKKDTKIIVGGPFSTLYYNEILNDMPEIDYIILGDGEEAMLHLIENESKAEFDKCIVTHQKLKNGSCIFPHYENVSGKFKPAEDFYLMNRNPLTIYTLSSKNNVCTGNCSFCCERKHGKILYRPVEDIVDEILDINRRYNIVRFFFIDDDLLDPNDVVARDRIEQMCDMLINSGKHLLIQCYTKTNNFRVNTKSLLKKMADAGFVSLFIGVESGNDQDLRLYQKQCTVEDNYNAIKLIREAGIYPLMGFIGFHPYSTPERISENFKFLICNKIIELSYYVDADLTIYKGTKFAEMVENDNLLCDDYNYKNLSAYRYQNAEMQKIRDYLATYKHLEKINNFSLIFHILTKYVDVPKYQERYQELATATLKLFEKFFGPLYVNADIQWCEKNRAEFEVSYLELERKKEILINRLIALNMVR